MTQTLIHGVKEAKWLDGIKDCTWLSVEGLLDSIGLYRDVWISAMIQNEYTDSNGSNVGLFSAATCTSQCKLRSLLTNAGLSALLYTLLASLSISMAVSW